MASIAAGNAGVSVEGAGPARRAVRRRRAPGPARRLQGVLDRPRPARRRLLLRRPGHRRSTGPSPTASTCSTSPSTARPTAAGVDTVERALLGAAEADVVVVAAAGNRGTRAYAAHASPWVTSVGGTTGATRRGAVVAPGLRLAGAMAARTAVRPARLVLGARVASAGATPPSRASAGPAASTPPSSPAASWCASAAASDASTSPRPSRGPTASGMVLVNTSRGAGHRRLPQRADRPPDQGRRPPPGPVDARPPRPPVQLRPDGVQRAPERLVAWTSSGDPTGALREARRRRDGRRRPRRHPAAHLGRRWDLGSGTSVAAARTSGVAAALLSRHDWSAAEVRSALATTAGDVAGDPSLLRLGAGRTRARPADRPGLVFRLPSATTAPGSTASSTRPRSTPRRSCSRAPGP